MSPNEVRALHSPSQKAWANAAMPIEPCRREARGAIYAADAQVFRG